MEAGVHVHLHQDLPHDVGVPPLFLVEVVDEVENLVVGLLLAVGLHLRLGGTGALHKHRFPTLDFFLDFFNLTHL